ncbi:ImmA/IrrE family metallo-endopeptidase [Peribacillus asahii]|uniref:ImmA/IrrE family metallo-endopeptidase n=1 Tax=Peribacillus asahii TaxID=228899 RepID=UPI0037FE466E
MYRIQYPTTALEDWITNFYTRLNINHPRQINEEHIARNYRIFLHRKPLPSSFEVIGRYQGINIDSREPLEMQREMFFHELCHILRHSGIQSMMPNAFRELQERDAQHFTRYAAIPCHMLKYLDMYDPDIIDNMVSLFKVTPELCETRLLQIKGRMNTYQIHIS